MKLTIHIIQPGRKRHEIVTQVPEPTLEQAKKLWEAEQALNSVAGNLRVHINLTEDDALPTGCTCGADMVPGRADKEHHSNTCPRAQ